MDRLVPDAPVRLILFDVDGTLIERGDPDHLAAIDAGLRAVYPRIGASIRDIDFDGKVDRQIVRAVLSVGGMPADVDLATIARILDAAADSYQSAWEGRASGDADLLPGVRDLVMLLAADRRFALGVLTGGVRGVVETKLKRLELERYFPVGAFGDEVEVRAELLPLAMSRAEDHYHRRFEPACAVVVGDTPHDVSAAHEGGAPCLAVATGRFTVQELRAAGADMVLSDLSDTARVVDVLSSIARD